MIVLLQTLWIVLIFYIDLFLPLGCKAAIETKEIRKEHDEEILDYFNLKPPRKLLEVGNSEPLYSYSSSSSLSSTQLFILLGAIFILFLLLLKLCMKLRLDDGDDEAARIVVHPPPRHEHRPDVRRSYANSRPLAPPMTSRSLILLPEDRHNHTLFIAIENPSYIPPTTNCNDGQRKTNNPTPLLDLPPDYESIAQGNSLTTTSTTKIPKDSQKELSKSPPKYEDLPRERKKLDTLKDS